MTRSKRLERIADSMLAQEGLEDNALPPYRADNAQVLLPLCESIDAYTDRLTYQQVFERPDPCPMCEDCDGDCTS
jgi:hypothetical protein